VTKLACWLGRHEWTTRVEEGVSYKVCSACGKTSHPEPAEEHYPGTPAGTGERKIGDHGAAGRGGR
jgi:hypothetical protein